MPLNDPTRLLLEKLKTRKSKSIQQMSVSECRANARSIDGLLNDRLSKIATTKEWKVPRLAETGDILIKQYIPLNWNSRSAIVYFRGSGFIDGDLRGEEAIYHLLASKTQCAVFAVSYRSAPEHKYPCGLDDAYIATRWVLENARDLHLDAKKIIMAGYSSGANFVAVVAQRLRNADVSIALQILICPVLDLTCSLPAHQRNANGYLLTEKLVKWYLNHYLPEGINREDPDISPLFSKDFNHLPDALIVTAELDPLCDDGKLYAEKLKQAGVPVTYTCYLGQVHHMWAFQTILGEKEKPLDEVVNFIQTHLAI